MLTPFPVGLFVNGATPPYALSTLAFPGYSDMNQIAIDNAGNAYIAAGTAQVILKVTTGGAVTVFAGSGSAATVDGSGAGASFNGPAGLVVDSTSTYLYVSEAAGHCIRRITIAGAVVTTLAGSPGSSGFADGSGGSAQFATPFFLAIDATDDIYVADYNNHRIRKVTSAGVVTTYAGNGVAANINNASPLSASFNNPAFVAIDSTGIAYVTSNSGSIIRKIAAGPGAVTTYVGLVGSGYVDGPVATAKFSSPQGMYVDSLNNLYVAAAGNNRIRKVDTTLDIVSTVSGSGVNSSTDNVNSLIGSHSYPLSLVTDTILSPFSYILTVDYLTSQIRKITPN